MSIPPDAMRRAPMPRAEFHREDVIGMCVLAVLAPVLVILLFAI